MKKRSLFLLLLFGVLTVRAAPLEAMADSARAYCAANGMNTEWCILVDMKAHSGRNRLWVWDFAAKRAIASSLCAHGVGGGSTEARPRFSNVPGSYCTSLGKYRIGARAWSQYGIHIHYKLHGLEPTNSNAFERIIVLHSFDPIPEQEIYPRHLPLGASLGCPVVSNATMRTLDEKLRRASKPVLLWIYY